jgi:GTP-binding protein HflX
MYFWLRLRLRNIPLTSRIIGKNGNLNCEQYILFGQLERQTTELLLPCAVVGMAKNIHGNIKGLAASEKKAIERLYQRTVDPRALVSLELAREMCELGEQLRRRIGVLIDRQGKVAEVVVGTKEILFLPDLGRYRLGRGRLRTLRLVFTDLSKPGPDPSSQEAVIPYDIYGDLERLRFDAVMSVRAAKNRVAFSYAFLIPAGRTEGAATRTESYRDLGSVSIDFQDFIDTVETTLADEVTQLDIGDTIGAMLVGVYDSSSDDPTASMLELKELARTAGVTVVDAVIQKRKIDPKTFMGSGKLQELVIRCIRLGADMLIFDAELKPSQWRSITNSTELKVIDRSMLILDIFGQRAKSSDGRLQVELAQLRYNLPRLVDKDAGLSRLSGGIGGRGPGETKLEIGRRRIRDRISEIEKRIGKVREARDFRRTRRRDNQLPLLSIVGYTNAGKSTLFNLLTNSKVLVENKLFATLDTSQRRLFIPTATEASTSSAGRTVILSDTVGFIRRLPQELENAFRATLEELYDAAVLLHVVDASDPDVVGKYEAVRRILKQMELGETPQIVVLNKCDAASDEVVTQLVSTLAGVAVSATKKLGIRELFRNLAPFVTSGPATRGSLGDSAADW